MQLSDLANVGVLVGSLLALSAAAASAPLQGRAREIEYEVHRFTQSPFAIHGFRASLNKKDAPQTFIDTGALWARTAITCFSTERKEGKYDWRRPDDSIRAHAETGTLTVPWLVSSSPWAQSDSLRELNKKAADRGSPQGNYANLELPPDIESYRRWLTAVVERYDGDGVDDMPGLRRGLHYWQVENEWTRRWVGTPEELLELHRVASETIRAADPDAKIVLGGLTTIEGMALADDYLADGALIVSGTPISAETVKSHPEAQKILALIDAIFTCGSAYFDVVSFHKYGRYDHIPACVAWLEDRMATNDYSRPIISTEMGGPFIAGCEAYTEEAHVDAVVRYHAVSLACGVQQVYWSGLFGSGVWGPSYSNTLLVTPGRRKRPAYFTYQLLVKKLAGLQSAVRVPVEEWDSETRIYRFEREAGPVYIMWSERINGRHLAFPIEANGVRQTDVKGEETSHAVSDGKVVLDLTTSPVFVEPIK